MDGTVEYRGSRYQVAVGVEQGGGGEPRFAAWLLDLPGCIAEGATREEARQRLEVLAPAFFQALERANVEIPAPGAVPAIVVGPLAFYDAETGASMYVRPGELPPPRLVGSPGYTLELSPA